MAHKANRQGRGILVLDPMYDPGWPRGENCFVTASKEQFLAAVWRSKSCEVFVDEAGDAIGQYDLLMRKLATRGRHWGHNCYFMTQDAKSVAPVLRAQCRYLFLFQMHKERAKDLAIGWNEDRLIEAGDLPLGQCFVKRKGIPGVKVLNVFQQED